MFKKSLLALMLSTAATAFAMPFSSQHLLVFEEESGKVLLEKNAHDVVPIASLTKLMTAMVVLDAKLDMNETIVIDESDVDRFKFSSSRVPVGAVLTRAEVLELALMSSDNRAAHALARTYPGGMSAFVRATQAKLIELDMRNTTIEEPTGLSPRNRSTATDLVKMATAASYYPEITSMSTGIEEVVEMNGRPVQYRNTNRLIGREGWDIRLSKTGYTREAGKCLVMRLQSAGKHVIVVLLNARESAARLMDAENVRRFLTGEPLFAAKAVTKTAKASARKVARSAKSALVLTKSKMKTKPGRKRPTT